MFQANKLRITQSRCLQNASFSFSVANVPVYVVWSNNSVTQSPSKDLQVSFRSVTVAINTLGYFFFYYYSTPSTSRKWGEGRELTVLQFKVFFLSQLN